MVIARPTKANPKINNHAKTSVQAPRVLPVPSSPSRPRPRSYSQSAHAHSVCKPLRSCLTPLFCSHYPNACSRLFYLRTVPYYQQFVIREGKEKIKKENPHYNNTPSHKKPPFKPLRPS